MKLRRVFAAWLLRLARKLAARSRREPQPAAVSAPGEAPAHWLALLRPGARRLSIRNGVSAEAVHAPPQPAPRAPSERGVTQLPVNPAACDPDWKVVVRSRARELAAMRAPAGATREEPRADHSPAHSDARVPLPGRGEACVRMPSAVEPVQPDIVPPRRERSTPTRLSERIAPRKPASPEPNGEVAPAPQTQREPTPVRALRPAHVVSLATSEDRQPAPIAATLRTPPRRVETAPVASRPARPEPLALEQLPAPQPPSSRRASVPVARVMPASISNIHRDETRAVAAARVQRPAPAPESQWPSLPDESGDAAPVSFGWPVLPRDASEWPSDETLEDRSARSAHDTFLRAEQRGERWNA